MDKFFDFKCRTKAWAEQLGFPSIVPTIKLLGPTQDNVCIQRDITVSGTAPQIFVGAPISLWMNPVTWQIFKSVANTWTEVFTYDDMFFENTGGGGSSAIGADGVATQPIMLSRNPMLPQEAATKSYIDSVLALVASSNLYVSAPVADLNALRAIDTLQVKDKQVVYVESVQTLFAYDLQGVGVDNNFDTIVPNSSVGTWNSTTPTVLNGGTF